jgi:hypothetical protein
MKLRPLAALALVAVVPLAGAVADDVGSTPSTVEQVATVRSSPSVPPVPVTDPPTRPRVLVYGDSLLWEAQDVLRFLVGDRVELEIEAFGGTALCDYASTAVDRARATRADLVVFEFSGNAFTPCMESLQGSDAIAARYRSDAESTAARLAGLGVDVVFVTPPPTFECAPDAGRELPARAVGALPSGCSAAPHHLEEVYRDVAEQARRAGSDVEVVDGTRGLTSPSGGWTNVVPCRPGEGEAEGCREGLIDVRAPDAIHFCPQVTTSTSGVVAGCANYSAGAVRFASTLAGAVSEGTGPEPGS